ncbi:MAG TPA: glycerol-3-phosphate 1-O-acyltransferase PlsY [Thermomicrobiales bacterium]|jgi:glycerol-3-phosphate acyltransferase PlsY|nr:glycerol-3-phosphate 1-O-acyltransferase PlsY [Thermomicrobiales bacterium]
MLEGSVIGGLALLLVAYLLGAIPWGVVIGRLLTGVDLRGHGSGSIGTTNALRVYGRKVAIPVLVLDLLKGALPVAVGYWLDLPMWSVAFAAVAATVGHCWSVFLKGTGGKGVATGGAAVVALTPWALIGIPIMLLIVATTRYVSLASITLAVVVPFVFLGLAFFDLLSWWVVLATAIIGVIIILKHRGNIDRLRRGTENRFGERAATTSSAPATPASASA